ncbi:hypothetical protein KCQ_14540 [Pectobacterium atrosepticum ICMP 1526]|nr:hypothetical protein KCQ_14540 [Pectobacterium atrosepticum ICMP 1526]
MIKLLVAWLPFNEHRDQPYYIFFYYADFDINQYLAQQS